MRRVAIVTGCSGDMKYLTGLTTVALSVAVAAQDVTFQLGNL